MSVPERRTERLLMRGFTGADREPFAALNADPVVMEHFQSTMTREATDGFVDRIDACWADRGWGLWAIEVLPCSEAPDGVPFIGYVGMWPAEHIPGHPTAEVGWRLAHEHWGRGYAPEAAVETLRYAFDEIGLPEMVSFTSVDNLNSRRVMEKIGLRHNPDRDFAHPNVDPVAHPHLVAHVFYEMSTADWRASQRNTAPPRAG